MPGRVFTPGASDLESRITVLADKLTSGLRPLARVAYNFAWSWDPDPEDTWTLSQSKTASNELATAIEHWLGASQPASGPGGP